MLTSELENRFSIVAPEVSENYDLGYQIKENLSAPQKSIPCIYFYDREGSQLFEKICNLPEYYLTRAETAILKKYSDEIISLLDPGSVIVELGSGSSVKTKYLIEEMLRINEKLTYHPIDVSQSMLRASSIELLNLYPSLVIDSVAAPYDEGLKQLKTLDSRSELILWLGSSIGNFMRREAVEFLRGIVQNLSPDDRFLIGIDLRKDKEILQKAYNDSSGITARFNLHLLRRINLELGGEFDLEKFTHEAVYNQDEGRIEMYLVSLIDQDVFIAKLNKLFHFSAGERIHTENSYKFSIEEIENLAERSGLKLLKQWFDDDNYFSLNLFRPVS